MCAYLHGWVSVLDVVLQVAHQHQVPCLVPAGMQSVVIYVAQDGAGSDAVGAILGVDELAELVHDHSAVLPLALLLVLLRLHGRKKRFSAPHLSNEQTANRPFAFLTLVSPCRPRLRL